MLLLTSTSDKLQVVTASAVTVDSQASYVDNNGGTITPGRNNENITSNLTTDVVDPPGSGVQRNVQSLILRNKHGSSSNAITVQHYDGTNTVELIKYTLLAGETLQYLDGVGFQVLDASGQLKTTSSIPAAGLTGVLRADAGLLSVDSDVTDIVAAASTATAGKIEVADQSEMETGTSTSLAVSPGNQHFHPGHPKCWGKASVAGGTPTLNVSYNVTSITDTNTDQLTVTIANDFSTAHYAMQVSIEASTTTLSATTTSLAVFIRNATLLAGSFIIQACEFDVGAATDPSSWHWTGCGDI